MSLQRITYPELEDPDFQTVIAGKKEFSKFRTSGLNTEGLSYEDIAARECSSKGDFRLTPNQILLRNFLSPLTPYNGLLLFHGVGVGKTCTAITIAEQFRYITSRPIMVLLPTNLKENYIHQLMSVCGQRKILPHISQSEDPIRDLRKYISDKYRFWGFQEFANKINLMHQAVWNRYARRGKNYVESEFTSQIAKSFSHMVFVIDEAHNMRSETENFNKRTPWLIQQVLLHGRNNKLIMMSATPMYNDVNEIVALLNFLLANDKRPLINVNDIFDEHDRLKNEDLLAKAAQGYVSFMRGENPFSFPLVFYAGRLQRIPSREIITRAPLKSPLSKIADRIYPSYFSPFQQRLYERNIKNIHYRIILLLQVSNIAFPCMLTSDNLYANDDEERYGKHAFSQCFHSRSIGGSLQFSYKPDIPPFLAPPYLREYSCKIASIIERIMNSDGIVFVYSYFLHSGILLVAMALEHLGFKRSLGAPSLLAGEKPRTVGTYSLLTRDTKFNVNMAAEMAEIRSGRVKVILGTSITTEGLDFKNVREVHVLEPWYHLNKINQVIGRAVRRCSHIDLPPVKRNVTVFLHAATTSPDAEDESIDLRLYRMGEQKQHTIERVTALLARNSIDCLLNAEYNFGAIHFVLDRVVTSQGVELRNVDLQKYMSTLALPFYNQSPEQVCASRAPVHIDDSTFDLYFLSEEYNEIVHRIAHYFSQHVEGTVLDIAQGEDPEIVEHILNDMTRNRTELQHGNLSGYLIKLNTGKYLFQPKFVPEFRRLKPSQRKGEEPIDPPVFTVPLLDATPKLSKSDPIKKLMVNILTFDIPYKDILQQAEFQAFVDFFVDRLDTSDFLELADMVVRGRFESPAELLFEPFLNKSLNLYLVLLPSGDWMLRNPHQETVLIMKKSGGIRPASLIEQQQVLRRHLQNIKVAQTPETVGAFSIQSGRSEFRIFLKPGARGMVCGSGYISQKVLTKRITRELLDLFGIKFDVQISKKRMCQLYEILLRIKDLRTNGNLFVRP